MYSLRPHLADSHTTHRLDDADDGRLREAEQVFARQVGREALD